MALGGQGALVAGAAGFRVNAGGPGARQLHTDFGWCMSRTQLPMTGMRRTKRSHLGGEGVQNVL